MPEQPGPPPPHLAAFVRGLGAAERALDLGCGDARLSAELHVRALTLADVSEVALGRARRRLPAARAVALEPDAPLPLEDGAFDLVLCAETIEHVRDVQRMLSECRRVLSPRGALAVTTPAHGRASALRAAVRGFERSFEPFSPHLRFFTARSLRASLEATGFEVLSVARARGSLMATAVR